MTTHSATADAIGVRSAAPAAGLGRLFTQLAAWWQERRRIARTMAELEQLSDRELADIGISRADILRVARESVRSVR